MIECKINRCKKMSLFVLFLKLCHCFFCDYANSSRAGFIVFLKATFNSEVF